MDAALQPMANLSFVWGDHAFIKSGSHGGATIPRAKGFCHWLLVPLNPEVLVVPDCRKDGRCGSRAHSCRMYALSRECSSAEICCPAICGRRGFLSRCMLTASERRWLLLNATAGAVQIHGESFRDGGDEQHCILGRRAAHHQHRLPSGDSVSALRAFATCLCLCAREQ